MKRLITTTLKSFGYRLVPRVRDPETAREIVFTYPVDAVIDVGANRGSTCIEWLKRFPTAHVYAFEPLPDYAEIIRTRTAHFGSRITVYQLAASDQRGQVQFNVHTDHPSSSSLQATTAACKTLLPFTSESSQITVCTDTLDTVLSGKLFAAAFLKLDVQGHELSVLAGARSILGFVRFIQIEINLQHLYENQPGFVEISEFLNKSGFHFVGVTEQFHLKNGRPVFLDALFERSA
ncbi:FkbM family methyltransferase [Phenylobacterium sp.]|uniref:FkbM family methyltransferase n=1 Tax=Phenylobacterium sp. TaxID=1871053 RepID=UPI0027301DAD|nr:FkbM family methyltransferase [Phenylobacterium sp.]MDP1875923.1 FkbM family methyltransferase [Phenylobacterium sp.]